MHSSKERPPVNIYVGHSKLTFTRVYLNTLIRSYEVHYVENVSTSSQLISILQEREYREMKQNGRSKHKDINDMLHYTILTI